MGCPETSVQNYHSSLRSIPGERGARVHRGRSLKYFANLYQLSGVVNVTSFDAGSH